MTPAWPRTAYGTGKFLSRLQDAGIEAKCKTQPPVAAGGMFSKDHFYIELDEGIVTARSRPQLPPPP